MIRLAVALRAAAMCVGLVSATFAWCAPVVGDAHGPLAAAHAALAAQAWARAETLATAGLTAARQPADSADWIAALLLARWRNDHEKLPGTSVLAERALVLRLAAPGRDSIALAAAYEGSAYGLAGLGRSREADARVQAALAIRERHATSADADIIRLQHLLGVFAYQRNDYATANARFTAEIAAREAFAPRDPVEIARATMSRGSARSVSGDGPGAIADYQRSLVLLDETPGAHDRDRLYALNSLVVALGAADRLAEAVELAHHAVELAERSLGPDHPQTGYAHRSLGYAYSMLGDYASAREEVALAVHVLVNAFGEASAEVAQARRMLAVAASKSGDFETALPIARQVLSQLEAAPEPDAVKIVDALNSVAFALNGLGRREEAGLFYWRAVGLCDSVLGPSHPRTSFMLANVAGHCLDAGQVARAESLLVRARALTTERLGPRHSAQVQLLRGLAIVAASRKRWAQADSLLEEAVAISRGASGGKSQDLSPALLDRARVRADAGRSEAAVADALEAAALHRAQQRLLADGLSEREALRFASADPSGLPIAVTIAAETRLEPGTRRGIWDAVIRARARVVDDMAERLHLAADPHTDSLAAAFRRASADLSASVLRGVPAARLDSLRQDREALEVALGRASSRWGDDRDDERLGFDEVRAALPQGAALVAYVRHARGHASDARARIAPVPGYTVFVLPAGGAEVHVLSLGSAGAVDSLVEEWNAIAGRMPPADAMAARRAEAQLRAVGKRLCSRIWDPVRARLGAASLALVVPDGSLQLVNFATLPDGRGWLVEREPALHLLTTERDLVHRPQEREGWGLLAIGAPDFDAGVPVADESGPVSVRGARPDCGRFDALRFAPLPGALAEMDTVAAIWRRSSASAEPCAALTGEAANESALKRMAGGHRVLHVATHGFYLDAACVREASGGRGAATLAEWTPPARPARPGARTAPRLLPGAVAGNPLMLAGLVLSGANQRDGARDGDDGVLTAQEIVALDLRGTDWAVLSACRTGVGEVEDGEGVSGLRRAFRQSGVRTIISSLWPVSDADACAWMEALYRARLLQHATTAQAVRQASLERLRDRRASGAPELPVVWGAFLAAGDWR